MRHQGCLQWHTSNKATLHNPSKKAPPSGEQAFNYMRGSCSSSHRRLPLLEAVVEDMDHHTQPSNSLPFYSLLYKRVMSLYFMCKSVWPACICVPHTCNGRRGSYPGTGATGSRGRWTLVLTLPSPFMQSWTPTHGTELLHLS